MARLLSLGLVLGTACSPSPSASRWPTPSATGTAAPDLPQARRPRLVLQIVVDQLRPDLLNRAAHGFGDGGFNRIIQGGISYRNAHNRQATTLTAVAHATIGTGGHAREHGIVGNEWFDRDLQQQVSSVRDHNETIVGTEVVGKSPFRLRATTLGDELARATDGRAKVFGISAKDRAAILITGKAGRAYWSSYRTGDFITSTHYCSDYPPWVTAWNEANPVSVYQRTSWTPLRPLDEYASSDDRPIEGERYGVGRVFPKHFNEIPPEQLANALRHTPIVDERTAGFAIELIENEQLGHDEIPDLLSISFSATDFIGHAFGPMSMEQEDNLIRLDRTLSRLFGHLDRLGIMKDTVIVLTADHGSDLIPEARSHLRDPPGRAVPEAFVPRLSEHLSRRFHTGGRSLVRAADRFRAPYVYLDDATITQLGLDADAVEAEASAFLEQQNGIARAITRHSIVANRLPDDPFAEKVYRSFHRVRSGDIHLIAERHWYLNNRSNSNKATHGSPYDYDSHVPLIVYGAGIEPAVSHRPVGLSDIAPTLARILSIPSPSQATGTPLTEVTAPLSR